MAVAFLGVTLLVDAQPFPFPSPGTYEVHLVPKKWTLYTDPYNGNSIHLGGFSGLFPAPGRGDRFYAVTDRGPVPDFVDADGQTYKTWAIPEFGPHLVTLDLQPNGKALIRDVRPLRRPDGSAISGLPTSVPATDDPYDFDLNPLPFDEDSIDAEGITLDADGYFWIGEEYKPSIAKVDPQGHVLLRLIPAGTLTGHETVPTFDVLPGVLAKRRNNRGFEGIAASPDGMLYAILQRPLNNPNRNAADANGNVRVVAVDLRALAVGEVIVRQFLYRVPPNDGGVTLSDLFATGPGTLLVSERGTDRLFEIDVAGATDLTTREDADGRLIEDPTKTLEQLDTAALAEREIFPVTKTVVLDSLTAIDPLLAKVEGVCVVHGQIVLTYDNDFNVAETAGIPPNPAPGGPLVQLELLGTNLPKLFVIPIP